MIFILPALIPRPQVFVKVVAFLGVRFLVSIKTLSIRVVLVRLLVAWIPIAFGSALGSFETLLTHSSGFVILFPYLRVRQYIIRNSNLFKMVIIRLTVSLIGRLSFTCCIWMMFLG